MKKQILTAVFASIMSMSAFAEYKVTLDVDLMLKKYSDNNQTTYGYVTGKKCSVDVADKEGRADIKSGTEFEITSDLSNEFTCSVDGWGRRYCMTIFEAKNVDGYLLRVTCKEKGLFSSEFSIKRISKDLKNIISFK